MKKVLLFAYSLMFLLCLSTFVKAQTSADSIYTSCEVMPQYPGGEDSLIAFIEKNLKYPELALKNDFRGNVFIEFVIEKDGSLSNIKYNIPYYDTASYLPACYEEGKRLISIMPKWTPAKNGNKNVRFKKYLNIKFNFPINPDEEELLPIFDFVEQEPSFPGGDKARLEFLQNNLKLPNNQDSVYETVYVQFVVERDGSISNVKVVRGENETLNKEVIRVIKLMPNWKAGQQRVQAVRCRFNMPVRISPN